jgi:hypothetical protein
MPRVRAAFLKSLPLDWLLAGEPHVRYRTLVDLLGRPQTDAQVLAAKRAISRHKPIRQIFARQNKLGYWGTAKDIYTWWPKKDTTFWLLGMLADFGLSKSNRRIAAACEYVFSTQHDSGGFGWAPPPTPAECFTGILVEALAKLGYADDPRLDNAYAWLASRQRGDGGFWCKNTGQPGMSRQHEPSCPFASLCVLGALSRHPAYRDTELAGKAVGFMLACWQRRGTIKYAGHDSRIGTGWEKLKYPFTDYRILRYLDVLSQFPAARADPRTLQVLAVLEAKRDAQGRFRPESIHKVWSDFDFGQKASPSRWLTLLACRIIQRLGGPRTLT